MKCPKCGMEHNYAFCPNCGCKAETTVQMDHQQQFPNAAGQQPNAENLTQQSDMPISAQSNSFVSPQPGQAYPVPTQVAPKKKGLRWWGILLIVLGALILFLLLIGIIGSVSSGADSNSSSGKISSSSVTSEPPLTDSEIDQLYTDPEKFKGRTVTLVGQVLFTPEKDEDGIYFQMYADPENYERNTVVSYQGTDISIDSDNYVRITGTVHGKLDGENAFGSSVSAPIIFADSVEILSYMDAIVPTIKSVEPTDATQEQYGYSVTVTKVEFAEKETRVYLTVQNNGSSNFSLYSFNAKIIQNGKQYEEELNFLADYPEVQSDLSPGVTTEGIIAFPAIEQADFTLAFDAYSDNWEEQFDLYSFDISVE